jgi:hypothetical protein
MAIDDKYSRAAFENASDGEALGRELESLLTDRMRAAARPPAEARAILADLERIGHRLWSWDESTDFCTWGDDYGTPPSPLRFVITLSWQDPDDDDPREPGASVEVAFGPWPEPPEPLMCSKCALPMVPDIGRLDIKGHGSVEFELLPYSLTLGMLRREGKVGNVSVGLQLSVLRCPQCNGLWIDGNARLQGH